MDTYSQGLVQGFLLAHQAGEAIMQAFHSIIHPNYQPVCKSEKTAVAGEKPKWSRWKYDEQKLLTNTVKNRRAEGVKTKEIIQELLSIFPDRKYNAIYTKLDALGLIDDTPVPAKKPERKLVHPNKKAVALGEASALRR